MMTSELPEKLVFVDVETSGGGPLHDRVIEVGLVVTEGGETVETWESLVNPNIRVQTEILAMTGIKPQDLETAPEFYQIAEEISKRLEGAVFVAHNARFDFSFLKSEFARLERRVWWPQLCTVRLSRQLFPQYQRHGLDALIERFQITCQNRHRALGDALATAEFYQKLFDIFPKETVATSVGGIIKQPALPPALASSDLERLPQEPGVYLFYGGETLLCVGKSINLRDRVWGHFYRDYESPKELAIKNQITRIETVTTSGELEALILESRLVKERLPLYNRRLQRMPELWLLKLDDSQSVHRLAWEKTTGLSGKELGFVVGIYRRRNKLKNQLTELAQKYDLCRRACGLEQTNRACFAYHLGSCRGVCAGREDPGKFNLRLLAALAEIKFPTWPFEGPISIREQSDLEGEHYHWFDQWCYLGSGNCDTAPQEEGEFDLDLFQILRRFLKTCPSKRITKHSYQSIGSLPSSSK